MPSEANTQRPCATLMIQGTSSDAGKSALATGLCRLLSLRGLAVAPFKPQNMSLNSAVTTDGGEIGRAQAVQAHACRIDTHTDMNPVLLKPTGQAKAQVIVCGKAIGNMSATDYHAFKPQLMPAIVAAHGRLADANQVVIVEGAGSPAEVNLRAGDLANMGFAEAVDCPVILVADIDRGGVFAQIVGTLEIISPSERARIKGVIINRFRGDVSILQPGLDWLSARTGVPVLGVLPYVDELHLEAEDSLSEKLTQKQKNPGQFDIVIPRLPHISNHNDFDPLYLHPQVRITYAQAEPPPADLIILPGSKNVRADIQWLMQNQWQAYLTRHLRYGGKIIGICGGLQMLGESLQDPEGIEGTPGSSPGLGLLELTTRLGPHKSLRRATGTLALGGSPQCTGYEIHNGYSEGPALARSAVQLADRADGAISQDDQIFATYLHGLFDHPEACKALLHWAGLAQPAAFNYIEHRERAIAHWADLVGAHLDMARILALLDNPEAHRPVPPA